MRDWALVVSYCLSAGSLRTCLLLLGSTAARHAGRCQSTLCRPRGCCFGYPGRLPGNALTPTDCRSYLQHSASERRCQWASAPHESWTGGLAWEIQGLHFLSDRMPPMPNQDSVDLTFLQTVRVMNRVYKSVLLLVVLAGILLFLKGWLRTGFAVSIIAVFDFGRRFGFDKGFLIGLDRGYRNGVKKASGV